MHARNPMSKSQIIEASDIRATIRAIKAVEMADNATLGDAAGVGRSQVSKFLKGATDMPITKVEKMLNALGYRLTITKIAGQ